MWVGVERDLNVQKIGLFLTFMFRSHLQNSRIKIKGVLRGFLQDQSRNIFVIRSRPHGIVFVKYYFKY